MSDIFYLPNHIALLLLLFPVKYVNYSVFLFDLTAYLMTWFVLVVKTAFLLFGFIINSIFIAFLLMNTFVIHLVFWNFLGYLLPQIKVCKHSVWTWEKLYFLLLNFRVQNRVLSSILWIMLCVFYAFSIDNLSWISKNEAK